MDGKQAIERLREIVNEYVDHANIAMTEEADDDAEVLEKALEALKAQLSQKCTTKCTPYLKEYATADSDTAIGGLREMGDNLLREIHSRAMSRMGDCISRKD